MTYTVIWEPTAINLATKFLTDDPEGLANPFAFVDTLATDPRPAGAFDIGRSGMFRVRNGRYRIVYEIPRPKTPTLHGVRDA